MNGKSLREFFAEGLMRVEKNLVALGHMFPDRARDDIARFQLGAALPCHKARAGFIDQGPHLRRARLRSPAASGRGRYRLLSDEIA